MALEHFRPEQTEEQIANCRKLAAYLRTLPSNYPDFEMDNFVQGRGPDGVFASLNSTAYVPTCGTAACAVGHGPVAGIAPNIGESWRQYSQRAFVYPANDAPWEWCFGGDWSKIDNTVHGAAARIEYMLEKGVPEDAEEQMTGEADLSYSVPAA